MDQDLADAHDNRKQKGAGMEVLEPEIAASAERVRECARMMASSVTVVTTFDAAGTPFGLTMTSVTCLSLDPAQFLLCVSNKSLTLIPMLESGEFAINVLSARQAGVADSFATRRGHGKFECLLYGRGELARAPVLGGCLATFECRLVGTFSAGDHTVLLADVLACSSEKGDALLRHDGRYLSIANCESLR